MGNSRWTRIAGLLALVPACQTLLDVTQRGDSDAGRSGGDADASASVDAGSIDAREDVAVDAGGRWCEAWGAKSDFCEDFDTPIISERWTPRIDVGTSLVVDDGGASSPPRSLLITTAPNTGNGAYLWFTSGSAVKFVRASYDVRLEQSGSYAELLYLRFGAFSFYIRANRGAAQWTYTAEAYLVDGGVSAHNQDVPIGTAFQTFSRIETTIDLEAHTAQWVLDSVPSPKIALEPELYSAAPVTVTVGIGYVDADPLPWRMRFDNVLVDYH